MRPAILLHPPLAKTTTTPSSMPASSTAARGAGIRYRARILAAHPAGDRSIQPHLFIGPTNGMRQVNINNAAAAPARIDF